MNPSSGKKKSSLVSREVMLISGSCVKQTKFSHTENTCSYKIQNIDVVFPFNMDRYLTDYNEVEIALTQNFAIAVDLDVDVDSKKIVHYGYDMSVTKEVEQFGPPKFWGRNLWLFLAGMFYLYAINNQAKVSDNFLFAYHQYNHDSKSWFFDDPSKLVTSDIKSGDVVKLNFLDVSCEVPVKNKADRCIEALIQSADTSFHLASSSNYFLLHGLKENTTSQSGDSEDPQSIVHADHVTVSGFVSNVDYDANHTISTLTINTQELYQKDISENLLPICVNLLLFLLFASATVFNGIMLLLKPIVNRIRNFKIKNIYTYRLL
ncbi:MULTISPECIES: hypothetical protein [unclassified Gilliamella]|uniref:hypothetical protein n=1 Tax=unclassified Gilliamella TaxID=2685620 RepID=UPI00226A7D8B|nr:MULTISPECIES: hypothetical protein [unclassified Gilliamella]MCX8585986.1 hypothetical protein [Gilliamella sp. B3562]MCX8684911.1 hypothetical protein [Gilliamella sp. B2864]